jgi:hypothetical protein
MFGDIKTQDTNQNIHQKSFRSSEERLLPEKLKFLLRRLNKLFKNIKIDQKVLKETLEITFWE